MPQEVKNNENRPITSLALKGWHVFFPPSNLGNVVDFGEFVCKGPALVDEPDDLRIHI